MKEIIDYLETIKDVRKHSCIGCGWIRLYDKSNISYTVRLRPPYIPPLEWVKKLVEAIQKDDKIYLMGIYHAQRPNKTFQ